MSAWTKHVTRFYREQKKNNKSYKFKNALKDARKTYKKVSGGEGPELPLKGGKQSSKKRTKRRRS